MIQNSPQIWHRNDLVLLANWYCLWHIVEIGVARAEWSMAFLDQWHGKHNCGTFIGVDPYLPHPDFPFDRQGEFIAAAIRYERHANVASLVRSTSLEYAATIKPGSVDFVYLDGSHEFHDVNSDILVWWPSLSDKGVLAGHDYDTTHPGVMRAVQEFAERENAEVYLTTRDGPLFSWMAYKTGMPGPEWRRNCD